MSDDNDLAALIEPLARAFYGEPNRSLSSKTELRFGTHGSLSVDLKKGTWFDHETQEGGGTLDLVKRVKGFQESRDCFVWMEREGYWVDVQDSAPRRANGKHGDPQSSIGREVAHYDYVDEGGQLLFQVVRYDPKDFRQRAPDPSGGWTWKVRGVRQVPYRLPEVIEALANDRLVVVVEGEKDADNLWRIGIPATCNAGGAGKWRSTLNQFFADADVVIIADNDPQSIDKAGQPLFHDDGRPKFTGQDHAHGVAAELINIATRVRVLDLGKHWLDCPPKGDVSDWIAAGGTVEVLNDTIDRLPDWSPEHAKQIEPKTPPFDFISAASFDGQRAPQRRWLVHDRIPMRNVTLLSGDGAVGKTSIALQLAVSVASVANDWLQNVIDEAGPVMFFTAEEELSEVHFRLEQIVDYYPDLQWTDLKNLHVKSMAEGDCVLAVPHRTHILSKTTQYERMEASIKQIAPKLVIMESAADLFAGNEIDRSQVRKFVSLLRELAIRYDCAIVLLSHPSVSGMATGSGMSGSTQWNNAVRSRMYFKVVSANKDDVPIDDDDPDALKEGGSDYRELQYLKNNRAKQGDKIRLVYTKGLFLPEVQQAPADKAAQETKADEIFMTLLRKYNSDNSDRTATVKKGQTFAPYLFAMEREAKLARVTKAMLTQAMMRLLEAKRIRSEMFGPQSKRRSRLIEVTSDNVLPFK